eukprot:CAMPEP_0201514846 /NCGR_PEP_ID=MMETSP0161_2-20130828/6576_1 /ASSEMBLY_ACC=CAM_ASM_000251 /TAXON_ID=180227 /ORGANISM="Neoparamoeba aestuarina, Strain SoJaBio B1-5/56/2" /LENGTH=88 /DNA_ID=CAMNT_0047911515 /DNA_START=781 /DNA_END=1043 /DNA_ORIENTATION=-
MGMGDLAPFTSSKKVPWTFFTPSTPSVPSFLLVTDLEEKETEEDVTSREDSSCLIAAEASFLGTDPDKEEEDNAEADNKEEEEEEEEE